jgi:hypothetical protein
MGWKRCSIGIQEMYRANIMKDWDRMMIRWVNGLKFQVLMAADMKMAAFWDMALYAFVDGDLCFGGVYCLYYQDDESLP